MNFTVLSHFCCFIESVSLSDNAFKLIRELHIETVSGMALQILLILRPPFCACNTLPAQEL